MKERPILFSGPMVRAILAGAKTQTRRICKPADFSNGMRPGGLWADAVYPARESGWIAWQGAMQPGTELAAFSNAVYSHGFPCPYGAPGDRLWVRETWVNHFGQILYRADCDPNSYEYGAKGWKPSIHMPRALSRLSLEIKAVRVERLQDISEADKRAEGLLSEEGYGPTAFADLWDQINGKRGYHWESNPFVWALTFQRVA